MANVAKIGEDRFPVLFGEKNRPAETVTDKSSLDLEGQAFQNYSPKPGAIYRFTKFEDAVVKKQLVNEGGKGYQFLVLCMESTDEGKTFHEAVLNLNSLGKRDVKNNPCHPTWYALGNIGKRLQTLCKMGEIRIGSEEHKIKVPVFEGGKVQQRTVRNADGTPKLDGNGNTMTEAAEKDGSYYDITPAVA